MKLADYEFMTRNTAEKHRTIVNKMSVVINIPSSVCNYSPLVKVTNVRIRLVEFSFV